MIDKRNPTKYYISLLEATKFCNYSQEYLSLRARHRKLKSVKLGRNWMTTKEWLGEYLQHNGNNNIAVKLVSIGSRVEPPDNLPVEPDEYSEVRPPLKFERRSDLIRVSSLTVRDSFIFASVFVLILAGVIFGKENLKIAANDLANLSSPYLQNISSNFIEGAIMTNETVKVAVNKASSQKIFVGGVVVTIGDALESAANIMTDYGRWISTRSPLGKSFVKINDFLEQGINSSFQSIQNLTVAVKTKIMNLIPSREFLVGKDEFEALKLEVEKIKKEPVVVQRVEVSKVVEPIKEITREVQSVKEITKVDEDALKQVRANISYLEEELVKRLYAPGGVVSQTIYVTEPVRSPKIYQENGEIVLQTLGSGNVILSAATGLQLYGSQVVIKSTSLLNPLISLLSATRIDGNLTVTGNFNTGDISAAAISGTTLTLSGNASVGGSLSILGTATSTFASPISIAALKMATGAQNNYILTSDASGYATWQQSQGGGSNWSYVSASAISPSSTVGIILNASSTLATTTISDILYVLKEPTSRVGIATSSPRYTLDVWGDMAIGTSTATSTSEIVPAFFVDSGNGPRVGIGTTTLAGLFTVGTTTPSLYVTAAGLIGLNNVSYSFPSSQGAASTYLMNNGSGTLTWNAISAGGSNWWVTTTNAITPTSTVGIIINASSTINNYLTVGTSTALFVDSGNGSVGIGTNTPTGLFTVGTSTSALAVDRRGIVNIKGVGTRNIIINGGNNTLTGSDNNIIGDNAGLSLTTGARNIFLGESAGYSNNTGGDNIFIGDSAGFNNQSGTSNVFIGTSAGQNATAGENTAVGHQAGQSVTGGTDNVLLGWSAGGTLASGINNTILGALTDVDSSSISNSIALGYSAYLTASNQLVIGANGYAITDAYIGEGVSNSTPSGVTINATGGSGTDIAGASLTLAGGKGTGSASGGNIIFSTSDALGSGITLQSLTEKMRITTLGKVGIATTSPRYTLDVWGDVGFGTSTAGWSGTGASSTPALYIDSGEGGRVGIGTTTLAGLFTVGTTTPSLYVTAAGLIGLNNVSYSFPSSQGAASTYLMNNGSGTLTWNAISAGGSNWWVTTTNAITPTSTVGIIINASSTINNYLTVGTSTALFVDSGNGRVGIGTSTTPTATLDITGDLSITGKWGGRDWRMNYATTVNSLAVFRGKLYAGVTDNNIGVYDGSAWSVSYDGSLRVYSLAVYNGRLYAGLGSNTDTNANDILVFDGSTWSTSYDGSGGRAVNALAIYNGKLYAATGDPGNLSGDGDILVCNPGNNNVCDTGDWSVSYSDPYDVTFWSLAVYNGKLFASQGDHISVYGDILVFDGSAWSTSSDGSQPDIFSLAVYDGKLYAGQGSGSGGSTVGDIFVFDGSTWSTSTNGSQEAIRRLAVYNNKLYAGQYGYNGGEGDVLSFDGSTWSTVYNGSGTLMGPLAVYNGKLYASDNAGNGSILVFEDNLGLQLTQLQNKLDYLSWSKTASSTQDDFNYFQLKLTGGMSIADSVGIATSSPRYKLDIWGDLAVGTSTNTNSPALFVDSGEGGRIGIGTTTLAGLFTVGTTTVSLVVAPNGNVGIATTTPPRGLSVFGKGFEVCSSGDASCPQTDVAGESYATSRTGGAIDVAEWIKYDVNTQKPEQGEIICASSAGLQMVELCKASYDNKIVGVVSTAPHLTMGSEYKGEDAVIMTLAGRVPVKISLENGPIAIGDILTSASIIPGTAMKATGNGRVIGMALESFDSLGTSTQIMVLINPHWQGGDLTVSQNSEGQIINTELQQGLTSLGLVVNEYGTLEVETLKTQKLCVGSVCVTEADFIRVFGASLGETMLGTGTESPAGDSVTTTPDIVVPDLPDSVIDSGPVTPTTSTEATFNFYSTKNNSVFSCQLDGNIWQGCESPKIYTDLLVGLHQFQVQAIDISGQAEPTPSIYEWEIVAPIIIEEPFVVTPTSTESTATTTSQ